MTPLDPVRRLDLAGVVLFALGLITYFVFVPGVIDPERYETWIPSTFFYIVLDLYIARQYALIGRSTTGRWRATYLLVALAAANWLLGDTIDLISYYPEPWISMPEVSLFDVFWFTPVVIWIVAARLPWYWPVEDDPPETAALDPVTAPGLIPLTFYALVFPFLHVLLGVLELLDPDLRAPHESVVLVYLTFAILLSVGQRRNLQRRHEKLETESRLMEEEARHRERMAAMGRLAAGVVHEVGNPLNSISAALHNVQRRVDDPWITGKLSRVTEQVERIATLLDQMRNLARPARHERGSCALNDLLRSALDLVRFDQRSDRVDFQLELEDGLPAVDGVADQLTQVFLNLSLNALDALESCDGRRPHLRVVTRRRERDGRALAEVVFEDNGAGVATADLPLIFEPSFTTKAGGLGLGLALVRRIVVEHGGTIAAAAGPSGVGTRFALELPLDG